MFEPSITAKYWTKENSVRNRNFNIILFIDLIQYWTKKKRISRNSCDNYGGQCFQILYHSISLNVTQETLTSTVADSLVTALHNFGTQGLLNWMFWGWMNWRGEKWGTLRGPTRWHSRRQQWLRKSRTNAVWIQASRDVMRHSVVRRSRYAGAYAFYDWRICLLTWRTKAPLPKQLLFRIH